VGGVVISIVGVVEEVGVCVNGAVGETTGAVGVTTVFV